MKNTVYFLSDAHLGIALKGCDDREKHLTAFLRSITPSASHLFIVGDLFDFWIEYRHAIRPIYFPILCEIRKLIESGTTVVYLAGNHDFALGPFLTETIGMQISLGHYEITLQGKKLHLHHGNGLLPSAKGYRFFHKILRNPINQWCYKWLHPNIGIPLATGISGISRLFSHKLWNEKKQKQYLNIAQQYLNNDTDIVVMGHTHHPELYHYKEKWYCNTGEWLKTYTYARLDEGKISLLEYRPDQSSVALDAVEVK